MKFEDFAKIEATTTLWFVGRERPGSWHEILARQKETKEKMRSRPDVFGQFSAYLSKGNLNSIKINQDFSR